MDKTQRPWTRDELLQVLCLYCKLPFGKLDAGNLEVKALAEKIGRTAGAVAFKLVNFASFDSSLQARGIKGAVNASKLDREIWEEFFNRWDLLFETVGDLDAAAHHSMAQVGENSDDECSEFVFEREGKVALRMVKTRVNQNIFRKMVLASYNNTCCITGLQQTEFLIASHIRPWSVDEENRLNPSNGIALNVLHDKAFECGYLTVTQEYKVKIASKLMMGEDNPFIVQNFIRYDGKSIIMPTKFLPDKEFLNYHYQERFLG